MSKTFETHTLQNFINDNQVQCLQNKLSKIKQYQNNKFNIFKVLKQDNYEIRHSNFLAWLLNPKETHGCGCIFLNSFLESALGNNIIEIMPDTSDVVVETEYLTNSDRRIDILIHSEKSKFVCVIENKYGSSEHDEQCKHYKEFIKNFSDFKNYKAHYIFLDIYQPDSDLLQTSLNGYKPVTYRQVYEILKNFLISNVFGKNCFIQNTVEQYVEIIKEKYKMLDEEIKNQCRYICAEYPDVLETLNQYHQELQHDIYQIMKNIIADKNIGMKNADINGCGYNNKTGCGIRFIPEKYSDSLSNERNNTLTKYRLFFALEYNNELTLKICNENWKCYKQVNWNVFGKTNQEIQTSILENINYLQDAFLNLLKST